MDTYNILHQNSIIYMDLTEDDMFDIMDDLSEQYYNTGSPKPEELVIECIKS